MGAYLWVFLNVEQNNWTKYLPMAKFAYNNTKNTSISHTSFELNCGYQPQKLYKDDINSRSKSQSIDKLLTKIRKLIIVC